MEIQEQIIAAQRKIHREVDMPSAASAGSKPRLVIEAIKRGHHWVKQIGLWIRTCGDNGGNTAISDRQVKYCLKQLESKGQVKYENHKWVVA